MSPSPPTATPNNARTPNGEDYDAVADMFLGEPAPLSVASRAQHDQPNAAPMKTPPPELLIAGHLPILSGAWVTQYASRLARRSGVPVALVQLSAERTAIQILWANDPHERPERCTDLRLATRAASEAGARWLIAADEPSTLALLSDDRVGSACLLTAPNEAATVAAYQSLKAIASELASHARAESFALRVAFAGASESDAHRSLDRIDRAAGVFMHRRIELAAAIDRIAPTIATPIYESEHPTDAIRFLDLLDEPTVTVRAPVRVADRAPRAPSSPLRFDPTLPEPPAFRPVSDRTQPEPAAPIPSETLPGLHALLSEAALRPTPMRCPDAPAVEIAIDDLGTLHALRHTMTNDLDACVRELWAALAWLERQASLVNMALRRDGSTTIKSCAHLFVPAARDARTLLDTPIRVYLHRTASSQGRTFAFCEPLN